MLKIIIITVVAAFTFGLTCALIGGVISLVEKLPFRKYTGISLDIISASTGCKYHADRYVLVNDRTPWLRIYNGSNGFQWYPIWHFKDPFLIMLMIDPDYAKDNTLKLIGIQEQSNNLTRTSKK